MRDSCWQGECSLSFQSYAAAVKLSKRLLTKLVNENRRSLDPIAAKCYFYYSRVYELTDKLEDVRR